MSKSTSWNLPILKTPFHHGHLRGYPPNVTQEIGAFFKAWKQRDHWWLIIPWINGLFSCWGVAFTGYPQIPIISSWFFQAGVKFLVLLLHAWSLTKIGLEKLPQSPRKGKDRLTTIILQGRSLDSWEWYMQLHMGLHCLYTSTGR